MLGALGKAIVGSAVMALCAVVFLATAGAAGAATPSVYVATGDGLIDQYDIGAGEALSPKNPTFASGDGNQLDVTVSPDGHSAYATSGVGRVYQYDIAPDGTLTPKTPAYVQVCDCAPQGIAVSPDGKSVYVAAEETNSVLEFDVAADGTLSPKVSASIAAGESPFEIVVSPDGRSVYVTDDGDGQVSQYDVGTGGTLSDKNPATVGAGLDPWGIAISPDGGSVYVADSSSQTNTLSQFDVGTGGRLVAKNPASVAAGGEVPIELAVSPDGLHLYAADNSSSLVSAFNIGAGGALSAASPATTAAGGAPYGVAVSGDGKSVYVTNQNDQSSTTGSSISQYDIGTGGGLIAKSPATVQNAGEAQGIVATGGTQSSGGAGAPTATVTSPADGATFTVGQTVAAQYGCTAGTPGGNLETGPAGCAGPVGDGAAIDTSTAGSFSFSVIATDTDGQTATVTTHYTVIAASSGGGGSGSSGGSGQGGSAGGVGGPTGLVASVSSIRPVGQLLAGRVDTVSVQTTGDVSKLQWALAGSPTPNVTCDGRQTELSFKAAAGTTETVSVTGVSSSGVASATSMTLTLGKAPAIVARTPAAKYIQKVLTPIVAKAPPSYDCSPAPGRSFDFTSGVTHHFCVAPSTIHMAKVEVSGCLQRLTSVAQVSPAEQAVLAQMAPDAYRTPVQRQLGEGGGLSMFELLGGAYFCEGLVRVNGVDFAPDGNSQIVVLPNVHRIGGTNVSMSVGDMPLKLANPDVMLNFGSIVGGQIPVGEFARDQLPGALKTLGDFGLLGDVDVSLIPNTGSSSIVAHLQLPAFLSDAGVSGQATVDLTADTNDGLVLDGFTIGPIDASLLGVGITDFKLTYTRAINEWDGQAKLCVVDTVCLDMVPPAGGIKIRDGQLIFAELSAEFPYPGIPLWSGVNLTHIGGGFGLYPTRVLGSAGVQLAGIVGIDGNVVVAFPDASDPFILTHEEAGDDFPADFYTRQYFGTTVAIGASVSVGIPVIGSVTLGRGYALYDYPGYIGFGGDLVHQDIADVLSIDGGVDGEVNFENGKFNFGGHLELCIADVVCDGGIVNVSSHGAGGCVTYGPLNIGGGVEWDPLTIKIWPFDGCKWSRFAETNVFGANRREATASSAPIPVHIKAGDRSRAIELDGATGAPSIDVTGPGGVSLDSPSGPGIRFAKGVRIIRSETLKTTVVGLVDPKPGAYTLTVDPGSVPVTRVSEAPDPPDARIRATVSGSGGTRTLSYVIRHRPDQQVTFEEMNGGAGKPIATVTNDRGTVRFTPAPGRGSRTIVAQFQLDGLPAEHMTVARFSPPSPVLPRVHNIKATRHGATVLVRWRGVPGATRYSVVVTATAGGQRRLSTRSTRLVLRGVDRSSGGVISVSGTAPLRSGRPVSARYGAISALRTPAITPLHPKVVKPKAKSVKAKTAPARAAGRRR